MPNVRLIPLTIIEIALIQFLSGGPERTIYLQTTCHRSQGRSIWRAANKVAVWRLFKRQMKVIFMADQVPEERQYALIFVAGGDEAYNHWDTLEDMVDAPKKVDEVWDAFEKSFEQSTSFWHFRDAYLGDFRQDPTESTADLDLHIKQTVRGCQWLKTTEEEWMTCCTMPHFTTRSISTFKS